MIENELTQEEAEEKYPGPSEFVHLHNHTVFSMLDGVSTPDEYFEESAKRGWPAFAITEHGVMSSIPDAYLAAKKHGVKQIVGCEIYFNNYEPLRQKLTADGTKKKDLLHGDNEELSKRLFRNRHLTILCKDEDGYRNLLAINKEAYEKGFYYKPRVWLDMLAKYREGLIVLSGCMNGPVSHEIMQKNYMSKGPFLGAVNYIKKFREIFGDDYYVELQMPGVDGDKLLFKKLVALADHLKVKMILSNDCHYVSRRDFELQRVMMAVDQNTTVDDPNMFIVNSDEQYLKTRAELRATFNRRGFIDDIPLSVFESACNTTLEVADKCETFKPNMEPKLPKIDNDRSELCRLALKSMREKGLDKVNKKFIMDGREVTYKDQLEIELKRIVEKGFASYFLITRELVQESKRNGWPLGPARGSAGGSLLCYLLEITTIDPLLWSGVSFNRFLSPARGGYMLRVTMED